MNTPLDDELDKMHLGERLALTTVCVSGTRHGNDTSGTCFFFDFNETGETYLATNLHVIEGAESLSIAATRKNGTVETIDIHPKSCIRHPDVGIDLCLLPIGDNFLATSVQSNTIPSMEFFSTLGSGDDIITIGYPTFVYDSHNNRPVLRRGICATAPSRDYLGKPTFLIDAPAYPGCSGSPVFLFNDSGYFNDGQLHIATRIRFIGILSTWLTYPAAGSLRSPASSSDFAFETHVPMNLGEVIRADQLLAFEPLLRK